MDLRGYVDGEGVISDDSDFYGILHISGHDSKMRQLTIWEGDERMQSRLEKKARIGSKRGYNDSLSQINAKRVKLEPVDDSLTPSPTEQTATGDVLAFLKSRPQVAAMQRVQDRDLILPKGQPTRKASNEEAVDILEDRHFEGHVDAWQQSETVMHFLKRLPVDDPNTARVGPWLWVGNPKIRRRLKEHLKKTNVSAFVEGANVLLQAFETQRLKIEAANRNKVAAVITRYLRTYREQLEDDLLGLAVKTSTTCGKWMFFPNPNDLPRTWRLIAEATAIGKLGPTSKVATHDPSDPKPERVICVYTYDFTDREDVRRVLDQLVELGLCSARDARGIFYKCDAYTYLDIKSDNPYKIKASLYSSKEMLNGEVNAKPDGPMARLKKREGTF